MRARFKKKGRHLAACRAAQQAAANIAQKNSQELRASWLAWHQSIADQIGKIDSKRVLGSGRAGTVYQNIHEGELAPVVTKVFTHFLNGEAYKEKEKNALIKVLGYPFIAQLWKPAQVEEFPALIIESLQGGTLGSFLGKLYESREKGYFLLGKAKLPLRESDYWGVIQYTVKTMLEALCHLQEVGLVHTDIKPDNVLFDRQSGIPKIIDLGDARPLGSAAQPLEGTLGYKAHDPPAANGATLDTFAVGAICYELTHGNTGELKNKQFKFVSPSAGSSEEERPQKVFYSNAVQWFKNPANRALHVDPDPGAVSEWDDTQKRHVKKDGLYGANTHYVQFVNALMHPDPTQRLTPAQALAHPFITDALMEPEAASQLTQQLIESRLQAKVGKKL